MQIKKKSLPVFLKSLKETNLNLTDSRIRDEFHKELFEATKSFEEAQQVIYKEFCLKNKEGEPNMTDKGEFQFPTDKIFELNKEMEVLLEEEVELSPKNPIKIKEFLNATEYKTKVGEVEMIDEIINKL